MAIVIKDPNQDGHPTGMTTGNEYIWEVAQNSIVIIQGVNTGAGTATVKYSLSDATPTDFTDFVPSEVGSHTATFGEVSAIGAKWIGVDVASGTWSIHIKQIKR